MQKKLTRHGNSLALVIDRPVLDLLHIDAETPLDISTDGQVLIISPVHDAGRAQQVTGALDRANRRYGRMLRRLAK